MQTNLVAWAREADYGATAEDILRRCVHCGFCTATCPTYQLLGDELDSPRGRIYLIKQMLEGEAPTRSTQVHLDRCLTCRNCETTCPSGVDYGHLIDIGRQVVDERVKRPFGERVKRALLRRGVNSPLFAPAMRMGQVVRGILPEVLKRKVPQARAAGTLVDGRSHSRQVILPAGCVQPAMMPTIDAATRRVLNAIGIGATPVPAARCCGAVNFHLGDQERALAQMRANIDAWSPLLESAAVEAIVVNASGCGGMIKEYGHLLRNEPAYASRAERVSAATRDIAEMVAPHAARLTTKLSAGNEIAFHPPCTLQHWQGLRPLTEKLLVDLGFRLQRFADSHLCCGSAGTYSILKPEIANPLRDRKITAIEAAGPEAILSSNIGCITHLQSGTALPVRHWIEAVDQRLLPG
jgi:glycolate oxidase iron-sulfur subunit